MSAAGMESSKVTVEYHDPSGIFALLSHDLNARLPLRNLNWQSPARPLRQIKSLHVDFVPDKSTQLNLTASASPVDSSGPNSLEIVGISAEQRKSEVKARRHQIPGFRTSPYLKVYVLRSDDKESYKEHDRRRIREWIRENLQSEGKHEDHDAFEWLILHLVIPDTVAASEPRWREGAKDPEELRERKSGAKLIGKSTRTVFDRLRADFNESSKSGQDHVAQIRLSRTTVPADLLPTPALAETYEETAQERENAWSDLITKLKTLILASFDRRVREYERDISEQEARRSLPGWNFCTFFIHKEGLAKALESIGLVEDALGLYDELSISLETVLRELASGEAAATATSFATHTADIKERISGISKKSTNGINGTIDSATHAVALFAKDYRELIVRSDISVFDFICYIFSRQKALILRLANTRSARARLGTVNNAEGGEDLVLTSEVCWRTSTFIHNAARALRQDLAVATLGKESRHNIPDDHNHKSYSSHSNLTNVEIDGLVCSWIWEVAGWVLEETTVPALGEITRSMRRGSHQSTPEKVTQNRPPMSFGLGANTHPQRTTSLPPHQSDAPDSSRSSSRPRTQGETTRPTSSAGREARSIVALPGQAELATYRAELISLRRKMLEQVAIRHSWYAGWAYARRARQAKTEEINLDSTKDSMFPEKDETLLRPERLSPSLRSALQSQDEFRQCFESLTEAAITHLSAATQSISAETFLGDLAMSKFQQEKYEDAASHFKQVLPFLATETGRSLEPIALLAYAQCLKHLGQFRGYAQSALAVLQHVTAQSRPVDGLDRGLSLTCDDAAVDVTGLMEDVIATSVHLENELDWPLREILCDVVLDPTVEHDANSDSFSLALHFRHPLEDSFTVNSVSCTLKSYEDPSQEIVLFSNGAVVVKPGQNNIKLMARTVACGAFLIADITFTAARLRLVEHLEPASKPKTPGFAELSTPMMTSTDLEKLPPFVYVYPAGRAFRAEVRMSRSIHVDKPRHVEVTMQSSQNVVATVKIKMKPTSAGLRLHVAEATADGVALEDDCFQNGQLNLGHINPLQEATISVPYTLEQPSSEVALRLEIKYQVADYEYTYFHSARLPNELPLDVDVNDLFQLDALYSNFAIRTTTQTPLQILETRLMESPIYAIESPPQIPSPLHVYSAQPVNVVYKITRKTIEDKDIMKRDAALALRVKYQAVDELLIGCLQHSFAQAIETSSFQRFDRVLVPLLVQRSRNFVRDVNLEMALLFNETRAPDFDIIGWEEVVSTLANAVQVPLLAWLRQWHVDHPMITLSNECDTDTFAKEITVTVDVPNVDVVFSASLNLLRPSPDKTSHSMVVLGQPITGTVRIRNTSTWSGKSVYPSLPTFKVLEEDSAQPSFICNIVAETDVWAIGGSRRCHFVPQHGIEHQFNILLIPLKLGMHHLPLVEMHRESSENETAYDKADGPSISCETHYESAGEVVHVVLDRRHTRVCIDESSVPFGVPSSRPGTASTNAFG